MFVCLFVCLLTCLFFILVILGHPHEYTLKISWGSDLIWLRYSGSKNVYLFVCLFVDLFFYFNHLGTPTGIYPEHFIKIGPSKILFICFFVCLFVALFVFFNHLGTPTGMYPEKFVKIQLDLAEIYRILKNVYLFVCLFVCLLTCLFFILIIPQEYTLRISRGSNLIWLRYCLIFVCLFVCLFVSWPVCFLF